MKVKKKTKYLYLLVIIAFLVRIIFGISFYLNNDTSKFSDDFDYISYARAIQNEGIFKTSVEEINKPHIDFDRDYKTTHLAGPGYPIILAFLFSVFGEYYLLPIILNALLNTLLCVFIYLISIEHFNKKIAFFTLIWSTFYIYLFRFVPFLLKETLVFTLFIGMIYFLLKSRLHKNWIYVIITSFFFTYLIHTDERYFLYFPIITIAYLFYKNKKLKIRILQGLTFSILTLIFMIPWTIRNYKAYNQIVILTPRTTSFTYKLFGYEKPLHSDKTSVYTNLKLTEEQISSINKGESINNISERDIKIIKKSLDLGFELYSFPIVKQWITKFIDFYTPVRFKYSLIASGFLLKGPWSLKHNIISLLTYGLLIPLFIIGIINGIKNKQKIILFFVFIIFIHTFLHVVLTYTVQRYRIPIDPFIIIISFYGLTNLFPRLKFEKFI